MSRAGDPVLAELGPIEQVVLQPTPFCNLACRYCYLPDRSSRRRMAPSTAVRALAALAETGRLAPRVEVRWHAGEPLVAGTAFYREAIAGIRRAVPREVEIEHSVQTNGTLIDDDWCRLFLEVGMQVGVSVDGPADVHDAQRRTRGGRGTHARVEAGIARLRGHRVPFEVIAVLTRESLARADDLYEYFAGLGAERVGLNVEESEGDHRSRSLAEGTFLDAYRAFLARLDELRCDGRLAIRELDEARDVVRFGTDRLHNAMCRPFAIVTVDCDGNLATFSPELLGLSHEAYPTFALGNVLEQTIAEMVAGEPFRTLAADIRAGVELCRLTCPYFFVCKGGAPSNKLYENGSFRSTETGYCRARVQIPVELVVEGLEAAG